MYHEDSKTDAILVAMVLGHVLKWPSHVMLHLICMQVDQKDPENGYLAEIHFHHYIQMWVCIAR